MMSTAYIGIGSNIAPRRYYINSAIERMESSKGLTVRKSSSIYDTYPVCCSSKKRFLNSVLEIETSLKPQELLCRLLRIEKSLGRKRLGKNEPRTIDLDILLYDNLILNSGKAIIPHPRMHKRDFVMFGMNEIAPMAIHPCLKKSMGSIYGRRAMKIIKTHREAYNHISLLKGKGKRIGFIPTMGYLHDGHLSLIRHARRENDIVAVSIFVNPAQFGPGEDYKRYPRDINRDKALAKKAGVDVVFLPDVSDMYSPSSSTSVNVSSLDKNLCGRFRPGHFKGVATVVVKLFNIIPADNAYFGQKDAQQFFIIKRMVRDLNIPVKVKMLPTVREDDGLAMSSRNRYLSRNERLQAASLYRALSSAKVMIKKGERNAAIIINCIKGFIEKYSSARVEYASIVDTCNLKGINTLKGKVLIAAAVRFRRARLIDNVIVNVGGKRMKRR